MTLVLIASAKLLGVLTTFSLVLLAPLVARTMATGYRWNLRLSFLWGLVIFPSGFLFSFFLDLPTGACMTLAGVIVYGAGVLGESLLKR